MVEFRTDKEVLQIMGNCVDFVSELIDYIAEYPDDDYMTMECLCRKLVKYDLIDKEDGYYLVDKGIKVAEQTEPCDECIYVKGSQWCDNCDRTPKGIDTLPNSRKAEQTEPSNSEIPNNFDKDINVRSKDEPQTDTEIAKAIVHKMIDDAVIAEDAYPDLRQKMHDAVDEYEPQTERSE